MQKNEILAKILKNNSQMVIVNNRSVLSISTCNVMINKHEQQIVRREQNLEQIVFSDYFRFSIFLPLS